MINMKNWETTQNLYSPESNLVFHMFHLKQNLWAAFTTT